MSSDPVTIVVPGEGIGKAAKIQTRYGATYLPERTRNYMTLCSSFAKIAMLGKALFDEPVFVDFTEIRAVPESWSKVKKAAALRCEIWPTGKPDLKNLISGVEDSFNGIVWRDDALIVRYTTLQKKYGPQAMVVVTVRSAENHGRIPVDRGSDQPAAEPVRDRDLL